MPLVAVAQADEVDAEFQAKLDALETEYGAIALKGAPVTLNVTEEYGFYDAKESQFILEDVWGNPPDSTVLGMLFPIAEESDTSEEEAWAIAFTYEKTGYVTDSDAATTDYDDLLRDMKKTTREINPERIRQGYPSIELVGWAASPYYDADLHGVFWGKDLIFDGAEQHTLNYEMRMLGRRGVLSMNFIANLDDLVDVEAAAPNILEMVNFNEGARYSDYQEGDKKAGYGVAALVAGGAGLAVAKKAGLIGIILIFLKKGFVFVIAGLAILGGWFKRMLGGGAKS